MAAQDVDTQALHRQILIEDWSIAPGSHILEIGCGQGVCTTELAKAVGPKGHIDALDPASLDYGSPETLGEAQARISKTEIGDRITWVQADPVEFLAKTAESAAGKVYDVAILCHSIWYFPSVDTLPAILAALRARARKICIAEYALHASVPEAVPHVLAALTQLVLEAHKARSESNIQTVVYPASIKAAAQEAGWKMTGEKIIVPVEGLEDGKWEVGHVKGEGFAEEIVSVADNPKVNVLVAAMRDSVLRAVEGLALEPGQMVRTMDVWSASFEPQ